MENKTQRASSLSFLMALGCMALGASVAALLQAL